MNIFDILVWVVLLYALWNGWRKGILMQLSGIVGIIAGAWVASKFSDHIIKWFNVTDSEVLVFVVILIVTMIGVIILLRLLDKVMQWGGLSMPIKLLGSLFCVVKYMIVMALLLSCYLRISSQMDKNLKEDNTIKKSFFFEPLQDISRFVFPYIIEGLAGSGSAEKILKDFAAQPKNQSDSLQTTDSTDVEVLDDEMKSI